MQLRHKKSAKIGVKEAIEISWKSFSAELEHRIPARGAVRSLLTLAN